MEPTGGAPAISRRRRLPSHLAWTLVGAVVGYDAGLGYGLLWADFPWSLGCAYVGAIYGAAAGYGALLLTEFAAGCCGRR